MSRGGRRRGIRGLAGLALAWAPLVTPAASGWQVVDYGALVDRRQLSHSGESVGALLDRLDGRPAPAPGERPADRHAHSLLEPLVEPYGFVLSDALDARGPAHRPPWVEVGGLWQPGQAQPAWVELLRARRFVVESDGAGTLRAIVPWTGAGGAEGPPRGDSRAAAREAWAEAWPVLRHALAAEQRRLTPAAGTAPALQVRVHAYRHLPARSEFHLGLDAETVSVESTSPDGRRPPLDLEALRTFFESGLRLEGARLSADGGLELFGAPTRTPPTLLGRPVALSDLAVAYRAVHRGGLAEPYMSLDRGYSPMRSIVNYGGRLRDTALGMVSLLCDIRFKTFSLGLDIATGRDMRRQIRESLPGFRSHMEAFAAHPESAGLAGQQTRLWFYPDDVDLTLSEQGDVLVLRRVRMSAASERLGETGLAASGEQVLPWTQATVDAINRDYDTLAGFFPEMGDLDQVVRLLSLNAWLAQVQDEGLLVPELDALLAVELPALATPRTYPQLLAFNALPPAGTTDPVYVYDRVAIGEALDRLNPESGVPLPARRRYERAVGALDPSKPNQAALLRELQGHDAATLDESALDLLAQRAERVRMHFVILSTLDSTLMEVARRIRGGEPLRPFSVGIGGLDLGMGPAVERARGRRGGLAPGEPRPADAPAAPRSVDAATRKRWSREPAGLAPAILPDHGLPPAAKSADTPNGRIAVGDGAGNDEFPGGWMLTVSGPDSPEPRSRRMLLDGEQRAAVFERVEQDRSIRYRFGERQGGFVAGLLPRAPAPAEPAEPTARALPEGLALMQITVPDTGPLESPMIALRLESWVDGATRNLEADFPRQTLQRLVRGRLLDRTPRQPLAGLAPLPPTLGPVSTLMVLPGPEAWTPPWEGTPRVVAGEEDPLRLTRSLDAWWAAEGPQTPSAVVGVDVDASPARWSASPRADAEALLLLPSDGFDGASGQAMQTLAASWEPSRVVRRLPESPGASLVVLVASEPAGSFARRLRELARDERMRGRLLAAWNLAAPVRSDVARSLVDEGNLSGLGLAEHALVVRREAAETLADLDRQLREGRTGLRAERLRGPFLWHF